MTSLLPFLVVVSCCTRFSAASFLYTCSSPPNFHCHKNTRKNLVIFAAHFHLRPTTTKTKSKNKRKTFPRRSRLFSCRFAVFGTFFFPSQFKLLDFHLKVSVAFLSSIFQRLEMIKDSCQWKQKTQFCERAWGLYWQNETVVQEKIASTFLGSCPQQCSKSTSFSISQFSRLQDESSVQNLIENCIIEDEKLYICVSSPTIKNKPVQIRPWRLSDADFVLDASMSLDPRKTVFVGGVPRPLKACKYLQNVSELIFNFNFCSGTRYDYGPFVWWRLLCRYWHWPRIEISKGKLRY